MSLTFVNPHTLTGVALTDTPFERIKTIHPRAYARGILGVGVKVRIINPADEKKQLFVQLFVYSYKFVIRSYGKH